MINAVCQEVLKVLMNQQAPPFSSSNDQTNNSFAGNALVTSSFTVSSSNTVLLNTVSWIIDSGASDHVTPHIQLFSSIKKSNKPIIIGFPDGTTKLVTSTGDVPITDGIILKDVLYVPDFKHSLLSVSEILGDTKLVAYFTTNGFFLQDPISKGNVAEGYQAGGLYKMFMPIAYQRQADHLGVADISRVTCVDREHNQQLNGSNISTTLDCLLWHARLGHGSLSKLAHIPCIDKYLNKADFSCEACILAKFHRDPFSLSKSTTSVPFELVHMDL